MPCLSVTHNRKIQIIFLFVQSKIVYQYNNPLFLLIVFLCNMNFTFPVLLIC
jgi:hypothetical protein